MTAKENTYFIDPGSEAEVTRLNKQDRFLNRYTDLLPREFVPWRDAQILDLACGPGGWALDVVDRFPMTHVVGVDIDANMIAYAQAQAQVQEQDRVVFQQGSVLQHLAFPENTFDFINARFLQGCLKVTDWDTLLKECYRLSKPGGIIRLTETGMRIIANGPNQDRLSQLVYQAFWRADMAFSEADIAITPMLGYFLTQGHYRVLSETPYLINLSWGTEFYRPWIESQAVTTHLIKPFLLKYTSATEEEISALIEGCGREMRSETHREHWFLTSVVGQKPE